MHDIKKFNERSVSGGSYFSLYQRISAGVEAGGGGWGTNIRVVGESNKGRGVLKRDEKWEPCYLGIFGSLDNLDYAGRLSQLTYSHRPKVFGKRRFYTKFDQKQPSLFPEKPTFQSAKTDEIFTQVRKSARFPTL